MDGRITLKDYRRENALFARRILFSLIMVALLSLLLLARYYYLQVIRHDDFVTRAEANRILAQPVAPTRGLIFDRNGVILADNHASYTLAIVRERTDDIEAVIRELSEIVAITERDIEKFRLKNRARRPYEAVPLRYRLTEEEIARIAVHEYRMPGVEVVAELVRNYPMGDLYAHSIGYVGRINDRDEKSIEESGKSALYQDIDFIGKIGIERVYEEVLLGQLGVQNVEVNAKGRVLRILDRQAPVAGQDVMLSIDTRLQQEAVNALGTQRGAVVAIEVATGAVLVAASTPSFDPNPFVTGISSSAYKALREHMDVPLYNRFLQGEYPPGSTIKPVLALAGLEYGLVTPEYAIYDPGFYYLDGYDRPFHDWKRGGHGMGVNLKQAVAESCDTYFYKLAQRMGIDRYHAFLDQFGLGKRTGVDLTHERSGILPSKAWKREKYSEPWYPGDMLNVGIGQGYLVTTPMQLADMIATVARRGQRIVPHLVQKIGDKPYDPKALPPVKISQPEYWDVIFDAMREVVHGQRGTAKKMGQGLAYEMAGKTGTAQVIAATRNASGVAQKIAEERSRDHALFVAFAPVDAPAIAVAVLVENGEHGSSAASPVARRVMDRYMAYYAPGAVHDAQQ